MVGMFVADDEELEATELDPDLLSQSSCHSDIAACILREDKISKFLMKSNDRKVLPNAVAKTLQRGMLMENVESWPGLF